MRPTSLARFSIILLVAALPVSARSQETIVQGMNLVNPHRRTVADQDALIAELRANHIPVVRCWIRPEAKDIDFAKRLYAAGIQMDVLINPEYPPNTPVRAAQPILYPRMWALPKLSDASVELSTKAFEWIFAQLDANGIKAAGFELFNEINAAGFNGEFPLPGEGKTFDLQDLSIDPEGRQLAKGFLQYLRVLAALKQVRDHSSLNSRAPIILAGMAPVGVPSSHPNYRADAVTINATLQFMRLHGIDDLVDAYGVHIYPKIASPAAMKADIDANNVAECGKTKPCWITEWGFDNDSFSCPVNDDARAVLVQSLMDDYRGYVKQGKVTGVFFFSWDTEPTSSEPSPRTIYRCGQMTRSGREAMEPLRR